VAVQITSVEEARRVVADFRKVGAFARVPRGQAAWVTAIFGPLLAIPGILVAIPATAHSVMKTDPAPIALLGTLFFGWFAVVAIRTIRRYHSARRYLQRHGA
jgi:hypothetical protein